MTEAKSDSVQALSPMAERALSRLRARGFLRANSSYDTLVGLQELREAGIARWDAQSKRWVAS